MKTINMKHTENQILVIFGASGDLTKRKLIPALYELFVQKLLPEKFAVLGVSRTEMGDDEFRSRMDEFLPGTTEAKDFKKFLFYQALSITEAEAYKILQQRLNLLKKELDIPANYIFYLSTPPSMYAIIPKNLHKAGLSRSDKYFRRLIVEKPFGTDLGSAKELNIKLLNYFKEGQIYRIDHYLGKETVQNMLVTRFSNGIFEPLWNQNYIHHVEITSAESLGVENRGGYYDHSGALRDMVQNHLMQLLGMVAMEPPGVVEADAIRNEILKVFQALRPIPENKVHKYVVRGQYTESVIGDKKITGYRNEPGLTSFQGLKPMWH